MQIMDNNYNNEEENFAELLDKHESKEKTKRVIGKIVQINDNYALVDIGYKSEGIIKVEEITSNKELLFKEGDDIEVVVTDTSGERPKVSRKELLKYQAVEKFIKEHNGSYDNLVVSGKVARFSKAGFVVSSDNDYEYFMPLSHSFLKADKSSVGKPVTAYVLDANKEKGSIVISRKKYILEQQQKSKVLIEQWQKTNEPRDAKVLSAISAGVFVDVDGINGMVPFNEISHKGPINPIGKFKAGDEVKVVIKEYLSDKGRLNLSIKDTMSDPWKDIANDKLFKKGDSVLGRVCNLEKFGAFVSLPGGVEALLHVSQISWNKGFLSHPKDALSTGDDIQVKIINIDKEKKQIQVSLKALAQKPFDEFTQKHNVGEILTGKVVSIKDFGAFVNLGSVDGLLHNDQLSWDNKKCSDELKVGDEIEVKINKIDKEGEKIWLSKKALSASPAEEFAKKYKKDDIITAKVVQIVDFGVFVEIAKGLDALIRKEDLNTDISEVKVGDELEAAIVYIDTNKNQIRLSCKKVDYLHEKEALAKLNQSNDSSVNTLGDLLEDSFKNL